MSAPPSYKPSDMVQSMEVKISTFTQQFSQTEINNLDLGKNNQIHLTNPAMVNHIRNSNLSSLTPSIEISPKYTTLNQQSSGLGTGQSPAIDNAGALNTQANTYMQISNFYQFTDMVNGSPTNGQTITFASTKSVITCIAIDSSGYYVCIGTKYQTNNVLELHQFQLVTTSSEFGNLYSLNRINYANYNMGYASFVYYAGVLPLLTIQTNGDYVIVTNSFDSVIVGGTANVFYSVSSAGQSWGALTPLNLFSGKNYISSSDYIPMSIAIDSSNQLHVVEGLYNNIYSYDLTNCSQIASTVNGNNVFNSVALNFGFKNFAGLTSDYPVTGYGPNGIIAIAQGGTITVVDLFNNRILNLTINTTQQNYFWSTTTLAATITSVSQFAIAFDTNGLLLTIYGNPTGSEIYYPGQNNNGVQTIMSIYNNSTLSTLQNKNITSLIMCNMGNIAIDSNGNIVFANNSYTINTYGTGPFNGLSIATPYVSL